jgi:hypothetical protein
MLGLVLTAAIGIHGSGAMISGCCFYCCYLLVLLLLLLLVLLVLHNVTIAV